MRISIISVGRIARASPENLIIEEYRKRINWDVNFKEIEIKKNLAKNELIQAECQEILASAPPGSHKIVLDPNGKQTTSEEFAKLLSLHANYSIIIGGSYGLSEEVKSVADNIVSFGRMTWPHMLIRAMLTEQLYRAWSIINRHPYHK